MQLTLFHPGQTSLKTSVHIIDSVSDHYDLYTLSLLVLAAAAGVHIVPAGLKFPVT